MYTWTDQVSLAQSTVSSWLATSPVLNAQAKAKHAHLDNKLKELHAIGNGPHLSELGRLQRNEQARAGLSVAFMDVLVTTDYAVQDEQEDIEVWCPAPPPFPTHAHAHTRTALCCAVLCCAVLCCAVLCCAVLPCCPGISQQYHSTWKLFSASCDCHLKSSYSLITDCCYARLEQHTNLTL